MIPVLGIPYYNRKDLLLRCVASIDYPVETLVVVQNGNEDLEMGIGICLLNPHLAKTRLVHIKHPNAGVAGAWNEIIKLFPARWWMLVNNDIQFAPGDLEKMAIMADANDDRYASLFGNHGHSFFVITQFGVNCVGLFDENIYPAYLEDCDWMRRANLLGATCVNVPGVNAIHGDEKLTGSCTIYSDPAARENNHRTHAGNFEYYKAKWGGVNGQEIFKHPFNDPGRPIWSWNFNTRLRLKQQWR